MQGVARLMVGLLVVAALGLATSPRSAVADPGSGLGRAVAWEVDGQLAIADAGGGTRDTGVEGTWPRWSPDGETIAFRANVGDQRGYFAGGGDVFVLDPDEDAPELLVAAEPSGGPARWSPDGRRIAVADGDRVVVVDVASRGVVLRTSPPAGGRHHSPVWSPLGDEIAFVLTEPDIPSRVLIGAVDGSTPPRTVVAEPVDGVASVSWSPDGRALAVIRADGEVWRVGADGEGLRRLTDLTARERYAQEIAFAPHGQSIAVSANGPGLPDEQPHPVVWLVDLVAGDARQLAALPESSAHDLTWTPDGQHIVVTAGTDDSGPDQWFGELYRIGLDGRAENLTDDGPPRSNLRPDVAPGVALRAAGPSRVETSVAVSQRVFDTAPTVVLARADAFPDALAGAPLAAELGGPLLLTTRDRLHPAARTEIRRLGAGEVVLLGSEGALGEQVARDLEHTGVRVRRIGGANRFDTARLIAAEVDGSRAYIVEGAHPDPGRGWPDAVAVSALAAHDRAPILLVTREVLPDETARALEAEGFSDAVIIGSSAAVGRDVEADVRRRVGEVSRLAGATRYETSVAIADRLLAAVPAGAPVWLATGRDWPDALAAGPAAAESGGVLLVVDGQDLAGSPPGLEWLRRNLAERAVLVGGPSVLTPGARTRVEQLR